ncbi:MAG TPA: site-2 protease family protein, partial [Longimicrobiaceae bacterium]|nr:site-2 protease family protein [Longimicrobiaceae bacterium]
MEQLLIALPVLIFSIVVHEVAHAYVARMQGDNTAYMLGRITLNPIPHMDPLGSVLLPGIMALTGGPILGWAKPVPVNARNFRNYKRGDILVSLAGVASNLVLAVVFTLLLAATLAAGAAFPEQTRV